MEIKVKKTSNPKYKSANDWYGELSQLMFVFSAMTGNEVNLERDETRRGQRRVLDGLSQKDRR